MARINIEDAVYTDRRFTKLCFKLGSDTMAIGALVQAWTLAQKFVSPENVRALMPLSKWQEQCIHDEIIEVGLAKIEGDNVYILGSEKQFDWLVTAQIKGRKGGLAKASSANQKASSATENPSSSKPLTLPLSLSLKLNTGEESKSDPMAEHFKLGEFSERTVKDVLLPIAPNKRGWVVAWPIIRKTLAAAPDKAKELSRMETAVGNHATDMKKQRREEDKIMQFGNFFEKGHWLEYADWKKNEIVHVARSQSPKPYKPDWNDGTVGDGPRKSALELLEEEKRKNTKGEAK